MGANSLPGNPPQGKSHLANDIWQWLTGGVSKLYTGLVRNILILLALAIFLLVGLNAGRYQLLQFVVYAADPGKLLVVLAVACVFPVSALAYLIFQRDAQIRQLENDFCLLGIIPPRKGNEDLSADIRQRYDLAYNGWNFALYSLLAVLLTVLGLSLFLWPPDTTGQASLFNLNTLQAMRYGFIGAYVYSMQLIYRRYTTLDLQPTVYLNCVLTLIAGLVFNYIAFEMIGSIAGSASTSSPTKGVEAGIAAIISFSLGYFPNLATTWFSRLSFGVLGMRQRRSDQLPLDSIDGISQLHETRLRDEGIDNIQNLASAQLDDLLINTRFTAQEVVEWVDQAILYVYLEPSEIESFRRGCVRTISDFQSYWRHYYVPYDKRDAMCPSWAGAPDDKLQQDRKSRALQLQSTAERLDALFVTTSEGPNLAHIENYWRNTKELALRVQRARQKDLYVNLQADAGLSLFEARDLFNDDASRSLVKLAAPHYRLSGADLSADSKTSQAWLAVQAGDCEAAERIYNDVIGQYPDYALAYNCLAWLYADEMKEPLDRAQLDQASTLAKEAVNLGKEKGPEADVPRYLDTLATVKIRMVEIEKDDGKKRGLLNEAESYLNEAQSVCEATSEPGSETRRIGERWIGLHRMNIQELRKTLKPPEEGKPK